MGQLRQIHPHHEARLRRVDFRHRLATDFPDLIAASYDRKPVGSSQRKTLSHDARFINKDLGRISNNNNIIKTPKLSATMKWNLDHQEPRFPIPRGSFLILERTELIIRDEASKKMR